MPRPPSPFVPRKRVRAFVAVELDAAIRAALRPVVERLKQGGGAAVVKWVPEANRHLTVKFLGDVEWLSTGAIGQAVREECARIPAFELNVHGLRAFPPSRTPRIVAAAIREGGEGLEALHKALDARLEEFGVPRERRPFQAHVTLGRVRDPRGAARLWDALREYAGTPFGTMRAGKAVLFQSERSRQGPLYTPLASAPLGGKRNGVRER